LRVTHIRKIESLNKALKGAAVWITGLIATQTKHRKHIPLVEGLRTLMMLNRFACTDLNCSSGVVEAMLSDPWEVLLPIRRSNCSIEILASLHAKQGGKE
jgi:hypothetical protein